MKRYFMVFIGLTIFAALFTGICSASFGTVSTKLLASDGAQYDWFGGSVSISSDGTTALVGASGDDDKGLISSGAAYIFKYNGTTWQQAAKLTASDGAIYDRFGVSVSINSDGTAALVGAEGDDDKGSVSGSAYIFKYNGTTWQQVAKLTASDGVEDDTFGFSVSISGDGTTALIGAYNDDDMGWQSGSAYIFKYNGTSWQQVKKLIASDGAEQEKFGVSVSISSDGTTAVVSSPLDDVTRFNLGSAYVFKYEGITWLEIAKLLPGDEAFLFGSSVSTSSDGTTVLVGAFGDDNMGEPSDSAYIFKYNGTSWQQVVKLTASDGAADDYFGLSVSINSDGTTALISAPAYHYSDDIGAAYIFKYDGTTWQRVKKLTASDGAPGDSFGYSVSINSDGTTALIGAQYDDDKGADSGSAYVFKVVIGDLDNDADVDFDDYTMFVSSFGLCSGDEGYNLNCDFDGDNCITLIDYQYWYSYYLEYITQE